MKFARFSEDAKSIILDKILPADWKYPLFNKDSCLLFSPSDLDMFIGKDHERTGHIKGFDIILRDSGSGESWSIIKKSPDLIYNSFSYEFHISYINITVIYNNIESRTILFIPRRGSQFCALVSIKNVGMKSKKLKVFSCEEYVSPNAEVSEEIVKSFNEAYYAKDISSVIAYQRPNPFTESRCVFYLHSSLKTVGFDCSARKIKGVSSVSNDIVPVRLGKTANSYVYGEDAMGVIMNEVELDPRQEVSWSVLTGFIMSEEQLPLLSGGDPLQQATHQIKEVLFNTNPTRELFTELKRTVSLEQNFYDSQKILVPWKEMEQFTNYWLKRQMSFVCEWSREFMDPREWVFEQVKNLMGMLYISSEEDMKHLIKELYIEAQDRQLFSKNTYMSASFQLQFAALLEKYMVLFNDISFVKKKNSWSSKKSLLTIMLNLLFGYVKSAGDHGLITALDERDGNSPQIFESVTISMLVYQRLKQFVDLGDNLLEKSAIQKLSVYSTKLKEAIRTAGRDNEHFLLAFLENGPPLGSMSQQEGQFFLMPQVLAMITGLAGGLSQELQNKIKRKLRTSYGYMSMVPAYKNYVPGTFWWTACPTGMNDNGGINIYENIMKLIMDCTSGDHQGAMETLRHILPMAPFRLMNQEKSGVEPYFLPKTIVSLQHPKNEGKAVSGLLSGNGGFLYGAIIENIIGLRPVPGGFDIDPCIDPHWEEVQFLSNKEGKSFSIHIVNKEHTGKLTEVRMGGKVSGSKKVHVNFSNNVSIQIKM